MEKTSSGGLNVIDRDGVYGVLAEDGTFSPVYRVPEEASPPGAAATGALWLCTGVPWGRHPASRARHTNR